MFPKAVIYKTNGDYNDNVPVNLNPQRNSLVSYTDPRDVSAERSTPIKLDEGWLLDRRGGIGTNTAFLNITYTDFHNLEKVPSHTELMNMVIPEARVTEAKRLNMSFMQAQNDINAVNALINQF